MLITGQAWGATWEMLESEIFEQLKEEGFDINDEHIEYLKKLDYDVSKIEDEISSLYQKLYISSEEKVEIQQKINELKNDKKSIIEKRQKRASQCLFSVNRQAYEKDQIIYGIELGGNSRGAIDIDHHDNKYSEKSSIEQVADVLGVDLELDEKFIAANDKGAIQAMQELGEQLGIEGEDLKAIISNIRAIDRQKQGITLEQEAQAQEAIEKLGDLSGGRDYVLVDELPHLKTATIMDRLYEYGIYGKNGRTNND